MTAIPTGKVTSFDIAYLAGVSQPTVSRALRGDRAVSLATRERIERIARELNYAVDKNASSLRSQRSNTIALLFFEDPTPDAGHINPFFLTMLGSITQAASARGLDLLVSFQRMEDDWHTRYQDSHRADGLILLGYGDHKLYQERLAQLARQGTRFVRWGPADGCGSAVVGSDNFGAGRLVGEHLLAIGCRNVAFLGQADGSYPEFEARFLGLASALKANGAGPPVQHNALNSEDEGFAAIEKLLGAGVSFDAVFAGSDLIAIGAMRALAERGIAVPQKVAVVGFDNIPAAALTTPPLTTIVQDTARAAEALVEALAEYINTGEARGSVLPARLILRNSTAPQRP